MSHINMEHCRLSLDLKHLPDRAWKESSSISIVSCIVVSVVEEILLEDTQQKPHRNQSAKILNYTTLRNC
jgi:hypothetical protein